MNVTYDYYHIFYYVAKYGSFTKAAEKLGNSQPNITRAMNNLESQTGLRLLSRSKKGIMLTPEGEQLYGHVKAAFYHLSRAEEEMISGMELSGGSITIGVSEIALHEVLLPVLATFRGKYPGIKIQVTNRSTPGTIEALREGQVNFALVTTPFIVKKPLIATQIKDFDEYLLAGGRFAELKDKKVTLKELAEYPWISLLPNTATRNYHEDYFEKKGLSFEPQISAATTDQILPMIKTGLGIGFVPEHMMDKEGDQLIRIQLADPPQKRSIYLITDMDHPLSAATDMLVKAIKQSVGDSA